VVDSSLWCLGLGLWACSPYVLGPEFLGCGLSPVGLMSGVYNVAFLAYTKVIFHVVPTSPKLMEYFSVKPYSLILVFILSECWWSKV
jgi:hypothetical protein